MKRYDINFFSRIQEVHINSQEATRRLFCQLNVRSLHQDTSNEPD